MALGRNRLIASFRGDRLLQSGGTNFLEGGRVVWPHAQLFRSGINVNFAFHFGSDLCLNYSGLSGLFNLEKESAG